MDRIVIPTLAHVGSQDLIRTLFKKGGKGDLSDMEKRVLCMAMNLEEVAAAASEDAPVAGKEKLKQQAPTDPESALEKKLELLQHKFDQQVMCCPGVACAVTCHA